MPHVTIEYSSNVANHHNIQSLVNAVHSAALADGLAAPDALRTRAHQADFYRVANGDPRYAFIAIAAYIGPGRTTAAKHLFLGRILDAAEQHLGEGDDAGDLVVAWSAKITEIDPEFRINRNHVRPHMQENPQ